jgi:hypothetical protein
LSKSKQNKRKYIKDMWKNQRSQSSQFTSLLIYSISDEGVEEFLIRTLLACVRGLRTVAFWGLLHVMAVNTNFGHGSGGTFYR